MLKCRAHVITFIPVFPWRVTNKELMKHREHLEYDNVSLNLATLLLRLKSHHSKTINPITIPNPIPKFLVSFNQQSVSEWKSKNVLDFWFNCTYTAARNINQVIHWFTPHTYFFKTNQQNICELIACLDKLAQYRAKPPNIDSVEWLIQWINPLWNQSIFLF